MMTYLFKLVGSRVAVTFAFDRFIEPTVFGVRDR
jgi:hypothetical protein